MRKTLFLFLLVLAFAPKAQALTCRETIDQCACELLNSIPNNTRIHVNQRWFEIFKGHLKNRLEKKDGFALNEYSFWFSLSKSLEEARSNIYLVTLRKVAVGLLVSLENTFEGEKKETLQKLLVKLEENRDTPSRHLVTILPLHKVLRMMALESFSRTYPIFFKEVLDQVLISTQYIVLLRNLDDSAREQLETVVDTALKNMNLSGRFKLDQLAFLKSRVIAALIQIDSENKLVVGNEDYFRFSFQNSLQRLLYFILKNELRSAYDNLSYADRLLGLPILYGLPASVAYDVPTLGTANELSSPAKIAAALCLSSRNKFILLMSHEAVKTGLLMEKNSPSADFVSFDPQSGEFTITVVKGSHEALTIDETIDKGLLQLYSTLRRLKEFTSRPGVPIRLEMFTVHLPTDKYDEVLEEDGEYYLLKNTEGLWSKVIIDGKFVQVRQSSQQQIETATYRFNRYVP